MKNFLSDASSTPSFVRGGLAHKSKEAIMETGMTTEYALKGLISLPMAYFYGSGTLKEAETIHFLVQDLENAIELLDPSFVVQKLILKE